MLIDLEPTRNLPIEGQDIALALKSGENDVLPDLGRGIINPYLKHREAAFQFRRASSRAFLGGKLSLQSAVDLDREAGRRQFGKSVWHLRSIQMSFHAARAFIFLR